MCNFLKINSLSLKFGDKYIFKDINFVCKSGSVTLLKGKNGAGKTCLLQCICSVIPKHFTPVIENQADIPAIKLSCIALERTHENTFDSQIYDFGFLMQEPDKQLCFPFIEEELFFGAENLKRDINEFNQDYEMLIEMFPILKQTEIETNALSFGQKKILLFSAMILKNPKVFLLDEPNAGLSEEYRAKFTELIRFLKNKGKIIIIAEHENYFDNIADERVFLMPNA